LSGLDDPELARGLASLAENAHVLLPSSARRERTTKLLERAGVRVHACAKPRAMRGNFLVSCDRWGTPLSVFTGCAAWTVDALCTSSSNGLFMESVPLARAYLDRWENLARPTGARKRQSQFVTSSPNHIREADMALTLWHAPTRAQGDLRDVRRLVRGARQGVLFAVNGAQVAPDVMEEVLGLLADKDLFVEGVSWSDTRGRVEYRVNDDHYLIALPSLKRMPIASTIVLVDPFGPHPVVMTGSHDLARGTSSARFADLLIVENLPGLAAEYAVHLVGMFDRLRFRAHQLGARRAGAPITLKRTDEWQSRYFKSEKRSEFNFFFGSLSPRL
jgi:hypothetical protein